MFQSHDGPLVVPFLMRLSQEMVLRVGLSASAHRRGGGHFAWCAAVVPLAVRKLETKTTA